jgi:DNA-binding transcriptional LysR family regulator
MRDLLSVDLNLLVSLDLLLDEGSVRAAARRAHVSPSAMSHTLSRLRGVFDDPLLVRAGAGMVRTPFAESVAGPLKDALASVRDLVNRDDRFDPAMLARAFRVVCTDHVSTVLLQHADPLFRGEAPGVDVHVLPLVPSTMEDLRHGLADVAIGVFPEAPPEMRARRLFSDSFVTVCRPDHPLVGSELTLDAYLAASHALVAPRGTPEGLVDRVLAERGLRRRVARSFPGFLAALLYVARSDALLTVSRRLAASVASWLPLHVVDTPIALPPYRVVMVWHPRVDGSVDDRWLREVLVRASASLPA